MSTHADDTDQDVDLDAVKAEDNEVDMLRHLPRKEKYQKPDGTQAFDEYTADERRAALYKMVLEKGHPQHLPTYAELGAQFGVSKNRIKQHMHEIRDDLADHLGADIKGRTKATFIQAHKKAMSKGEYMKAMQIMMTWNDWLFDLGVQDRAPEKREVDLETSGEWTDSEVEELLSDHDDSDV